jgi:peptidoglycan/LPS O-acetylase OafA/YrhL
MSSPHAREPGMMMANSRPPRNPALDFTKGALVLFMVLYHWLNYFISADGDFYRYIRFVTPSFIFISGFLISNIYLAKYEFSDPRLPKRLLQRGLKILAIFVVLNIVISLLLSRSHDGRTLFSLFSASNLFAIYVTGNTVIAGGGKLAAFYVLVPISYLLVLSAGLLILGRFFKYVFQAAFVLSLGSIIAIDLAGFKSANLELLTIGLLGVLFGYIPIDRINRFVRHPYPLVGAYLCYLIAITFWNAVYPIQVVGVCLSVTLIYLVGSKEGEPGRGRRHVNLLGSYSLFGYIIQIAILQILYRGLRHVHLGREALILSFFAAFALTMISVEVVDRLRARSTVVDKLHKAVFA